MCISIEYRKTEAKHANCNGQSEESKIALGANEN